MQCGDGSVTAAASADLTDAAEQLGKAHCIFTAELQKLLPLFDHSARMPVSSASDGNIIVCLMHY